MVYNLQTPPEGNHNFCEKLSFKYSMGEGILKVPFPKGQLLKGEYSEARV